VSVYILVGYFSQASKKCGILCYAYEKLNPHVQIKQLSFKLTDIPQLVGVKSAEGAEGAIHIPSASSDHSMGHALNAGSLQQP
jgi:hypothetical protein